MKFLGRTVAPIITSVLVDYRDKNIFNHGVAKGVIKLYQDAASNH
jgi:hypothetical protein